MKKSILIMIIIMVVTIAPIKVSAHEIDYNNGFFQIIAKKNNNTNNNQQNSGTDTSQWTQGYNQTQNCTGDNSILGSVNDPDSVAWLLQQVLNIIKVLGPILVVVLSSVEFAKVIINSDDEAMAKAQKKLITRIILAACLFFIPTLVQAALDLFNFTSDATCGIE